MRRFLALPLLLLAAASTFSAVLSVPALAIGDSYSIPVSVYAVNR